MEFITNRTSADVDRVREYNRRGWNNLSDEEKAEWLAGMKGAFNYTDYNRIVLNLFELENLLIEKCAVAVRVTYTPSDTRNIWDSSLFQHNAVVIAEYGYTVRIFRCDASGNIISTRVETSTGGAIFDTEAEYYRVVVASEEGDVTPYVGYYPSSEMPELIEDAGVVANMQTIPRISNLSKLSSDTNLLISNYAEDSGISPMPAFPTKPDYTYFNQLEDTHRQLYEYATSTE